MTYDCGDSHCPICNPQGYKCPNCCFFHTEDEECPTLNEIEDNWGDNQPGAYSE